MSALIALAVSIGSLAVLATWLALGPLAALNVQVWQIFIAWACFYHSGGKTGGLKTTALCMGFGALVGMLSVMAIAPLGALGPLAAPVAVGLGAAAIVLAAHVGMLAAIPASVYGFASIAGLILLKNLAPAEAIGPTLMSVILGCAFGWASEWAGARLTRVSTAQSASATATS